MKSLKYSKSFNFYLQAKNDFFIHNLKLLNKAKNQNQSYKTQVIRTKCKICEAKLPSAVDFSSHGVEYLFCLNCEHLNGHYEDSESFTNEMYINEDGLDYAKNYLNNQLKVDEPSISNANLTKKAYRERTENTYIPKVDFLIENIPSEKFSVIDIGCGAGYFVAACILKNINATGYDVSKSMTSYGNEQLRLLTNHNNLLKNLSEDGIFGKIEETEATVITAIGVIEHLRSPQLLFGAFKKSRAQYLYYSVPMFSISAILENTFPHVFPRQLSGGHTHLFTESSISYMHKLLNSKSIAEWRFGTDMMDLYRSIIVMLQNNGSSSKMVKLTSKKIFPNIDAWQGIVDKSHFCSEIHCLIKKCDI